MSKRLENKVAIITGGTSGIGKGIVETFAEEGAKVVFCGRRESKGTELQKVLMDKGYEVTFIKADVTKEKDLEKLVESTIDKHSRIDILVNNAGRSVPYKLHEINMKEHYDEIFDLNIRSYFELTSKVIPYMLKEGQGSVVNTSSVAGIEGLDIYTSYCSSKGAVLGFTMAGAVEYAKNNIRFNAVLPGLTYTDLILPGSEFDKLISPEIPLGRGADPKEIAQAYVYLGSDESSFVTGSQLVVDGGKSII